MKIIEYTDAPTHHYESETAKGVTGRVVIGKKDCAENFCMRVFTINPGGFTPRHAHPWEHEIFVHSGKGQVFKDGEWQAVTSGTVVFIPAGEEHQLMNAGAEDFTFICLIPSGVQEI